jgi:hypothetical protein
VRGGQERVELHGVCLAFVTLSSLIRPICRLMMLLIHPVLHATIGRLAWHRHAPPPFA